MREKISVIIPAYNVDKYIEKCLRTVLSQTYKELEVLVINDGSTDETENLIKLFTADKRLKLINQGNAGVTAARNNGINAATGEFLAFVDSDDWLEPDMYEKLFEVMTDSNADVAVCDYNLVYDDHIKEKYSNMRDEIVDIKPIDYFFNYCCCQKPNNYVWTRLYKTDTIKKSNVRFENFKLGDDTLFNFKLLPFINRVVNTSEAKYNYLQRLNSNVYTVAKKGNLAAVYADTFDALVSHYKLNKFSEYLKAMPIHAYTRLRSIIFYSRLAGLSEADIFKSIQDGFYGREIVDYLLDTSLVETYVRSNAFPVEKIDEIKRVMIAAVNSPNELSGVVIP